MLQNLSILINNLEAWANRYETAIELGTIMQTVSKQGIPPDKLLSQKHSNHLIT